MRAWTSWAGTSSATGSKGTHRHYVYVYPAKKAVQAATRKVKTLCRQVGMNQPLDDLLRRLNPTAAGLVRLLPPRCLVGASSPTSATTRGERSGDGYGANTATSTIAELRRRYCRGRMVAGPPRDGSCSTQRR
ncbi:MAG: hypothetical protein WKF47_07455 [Geodermatophilaceae bacterium]